MWEQFGCVQVKRHLGTCGAQCRHYTALCGASSGSELVLADSMQLFIQHCPACTECINTCAAPSQHHLPVQGQKLPPGFSAYKPLQVGAQ